MQTAPSTWHGHRSVHARCYRSAHSANSAYCSLSSSVFILTASAASLCSFSQDTLASFSEKKMPRHGSSIPHRLLVRGLCRALETLCCGMPRTPRGRRVAAHPRELRAPWLFGWCPNRSISLRGYLACIYCPCEALPLRLLPVLGLSLIHI